MKKILDTIGNPINQQDLYFVAALCVTALKRLGYIHADQLRPWGIDFGDVCEEKGLLGGTVPAGEGMQGILINPKVDKDRLLETIAHEAIHLIQFMKGDTKSGQGHGVIEWKGVDYKILPAGDPGYKSQPWEEEAYRLAPVVIARLEQIPKEDIPGLRKSILSQIVP